MSKKFALVTTQVEEFDSKDALEHYIKEHSPLDFDDKVDLLASNKIIIDGEDDVTTTIEILAAVGEETPVDKTTASADVTEKNGAQDGPKS